LNLKNNALCYAILDYLDPESNFFLSKTYDRHQQTLVERQISRIIKKLTSRYLKEQSVLTPQLSLQIPENVYELLTIFLTNTPHSEMNFIIDSNNVFSEIAENIKNPTTQETNLFLAFAAQCYAFSLISLFLEKKADARKEFVENFLKVSCWSSNVSASFAFFLFRKGLNFNEVNEIFKLLKKFQVSQNSILALHFETNLLKEKTSIKKNLPLYCEVLLFLKGHNWNWLQVASLFRIFPNIDEDNFLSFLKSLSAKVLRDQDEVYKKIKHFQSQEI
jgi:hypothetical protein